MVHDLFGGDLTRSMGSRRSEIPLVHVFSFGVMWPVRISGGICSSEFYVRNYITGCIVPKVHCDM